MHRFVGGYLHVGKYKKKGIMTNVIGKHINIKKLVVFFFAGEGGGSWWGLVIIFF